MNILSDTASWGLIVGVLLPLLTALVQQPSWSRPARVAVAVLASGIAGVLTCLAAGTFDLGNVLGTVAAVLVAAQASYESLWQPSGVAPAIEVATARRVE